VIKPPGWGFGVGRVGEVVVKGMDVDGEKEDEEE
jgi:hypothetical protein